MSKKTAVIFSFLVLLMQGVFAQEVDQMTLGELVAAANGSIQEGDPQKTISFLEEIISRASTFKDKAALKSIQKVRLQLSLTYAQLERWADAKEYAQAYLSLTPCQDRVAGINILCQVAFIQEDWAALKKSAQDLLSEPGKKLVDREHAELFLVQAHYNLEEYAAALELIPLLLKRADDPDMVASLRLMRVRSLFETGQGDTILSGLSDMSRGDAHYDIHMNLFLLRMGDDLFDDNSFRKAMAVYRMVVPKSDLVEWQKTQMARLEKKMAQLENQRTGKTDDKLSDQIDELKQKLDSLREIPEYDVHIAYRIAQIYVEQKRFWEAVAVFDHVWQHYPKEWQGGASLFEMLLLLDDLEQDEEALALGQDYLENNRTGLYPRLVTLYLMRYHHERKDIDKMWDVFGFVDGWDSPEDANVRAQETEIHYIACFAQLERGKYQLAATSFDRVIKLSPDSQTAISARYWRAMCSLMQQDYQDAHDRFVRFRREYPHARLASTALFRAAVCNFGLEDYEGAKAYFDLFIQSYPNNALLSEALAMRGDLLGADGILDEALADYRRAIDLAGKLYVQMPNASAVDQVILSATYALSQSASTLELEASTHRDAEEYDASVEKYRQIIVEVEHYETLFKEKADFAQTVFLKSKAQFQLGEADEAVQACLDAIVRYGADPAQQGVADILFSLGAIINTRLNEDQQKRALDNLREAYTDANDLTLRLRLGVLLAELDGTQADLGRKLLAQDQSIEAIPPSALGLMCSAALDQRDFSRSEELFDFFVEHYSDSSYINNAYHLRSEDLFQQKEYKQAMDLATKALELFGFVQDLGWAQLLTGRSEMMLGKYAQAAKSLNKVFNVPQWRGSLYGESMLLMADAWFAQDDYEKAFAFYQRTYLLYNFYNEGRWAADAYLKSAECLYKLKRASAARNTYRAMLLDGYVRDLPQAAIAKKVLGPEETVELLAGQTNRLEKVSLEIKP